MYYLYYLYYLYTSKKTLSSQKCKTHQNKSAFRQIGIKIAHRTSFTKCLTSTMDLGRPPAMQLSRKSTSTLKQFQHKRHRASARAPTKAQGNADRPLALVIQPEFHSKGKETWNRVWRWSGCGCCTSPPQRKGKRRRLQWSESSATLQSGTAGTWSPAINCKCTLFDNFVDFA